MVMESLSPRRIVLVALLTSLFVCCFAALAEAQGIQQSPYSAPNTVSSGPFGGLDLAPSNPFGQPAGLAPAGPQPLYVSDGMLRGLMPLIPNLQFGYLYNFGSNRISTGRFTADYLLPISLNARTELFGEAHSEFEDFWNTLTSPFLHPTTTTVGNRTVTTYYSGFNNRVDLSFGGGFRTFPTHDILLGVNGFYDTSRLGSTWYSSGGLGFEMAAIVRRNDAIDLNFNWYGELFNSYVLRNAFRYGPSNFDFQAGYSHELWNGGPDFRLSATGYKFDIGESVWGWNVGAELRSSPHNLFVIKYSVGNDKVDRTYQTIGGFINIGFSLDKLFEEKNPFSMPQAVSQCPRNLRYMLTQKVRRDWHQPSAVVVARSLTSQTPTPTPTGPTPHFVFAVGPLRVGSMTYTQDPGNTTGTMRVSTGSNNAANFYSLTVVGTNGLTFPLTSTISPTPDILAAAVITVRQDGTADAPETVTFPDSSTLIRTVPPDGNSGAFGAVVPLVISTAFGTQGTITITAPGVQTLTITIMAP
jgi:hypothetical protein